MLTQEQIEDFHTKGFLNLGKIYSDEECAEMRAEMFRVMHGETERKPVLNRGMGGTGELTVVQIVNMWQASDMYLRHAEHPVIAEAVAQLCDSDTLRIWHDQVQYKPPTKGGPTGWHQDHPLWPTIQPADLISSWVPFEDATQTNGCLWMVPGSHKWGNQQRYLGSREPFEPFHREPDRLPADADIVRVPTEVRKGECQLHHCLTWHGSPANPSEQDRPAIAVHYMPAHIRHDPVGSHVMDEYVTVPEGDILTGDAFPVVYNSAG